MRRSAVLLVAATAGLVPAVVAVPAAAAPAAKPTHVAIVIAGKGVACVAWHSGITGDDVLNAVATVRYRPTDGLITQIDGTPRNNTADETHYWSYWHNTGSGWTYSTVGASGYQPKAGTVEGWKFVNGKPSATPPPLKSYASICGRTESAPPVTLPTTSSAPRTSAAQRSSAPARSSGTSDPTGSPAANAPSSAATTPAASSTTPTAAPNGHSTHVTSQRTQPVTGSDSAAPGNARSGPGDLPTLSARPAADQAHTDAGSALPTVLGGLLVVVLGAGAWLATRRRHHSP